MSDSKQHWLDRNRPPRVQITYDVETAGAIQKKELPFVLGIMADLSGMPDTPLPARYDAQKDELQDAKIEAETAAPESVKFKDRKYVSIDRDNFDEVMRKSIRPRLVFDGSLKEGDAVLNEKINGRVAVLKTPDELKTSPQPAWKIEKKGKIDVGMEFRSVEDFDPINVIRQVKTLRELLETRNLLADLLTKLDGKEDLSAKLKQQIFDNAKDATLDQLGKIRDAAGVEASPVQDDGGGTPPPKP